MCSESLITLQNNTLSLLHTFNMDEGKVSAQRLDKVFQVSTLLTTLYISCGCSAREGVLMGRNPVTEQDVTCGKET